MVGYAKSPDEVSQTFSRPERCLICSEQIDGPTFSYHMHELPGGSGHFHADCAFSMAQRVIFDVWPHRRDFDLLKRER